MSILSPDPALAAHCAGSGAAAYGAAPIRLRQLAACELARRGAEAGCCGTCWDARAIDDAQLLDGARRSTFEELTDWTLWADKVISF